MANSYLALAIDILSLLLLRFLALIILIALPRGEGREKNGLPGRNAALLPAKPGKRVVIPSYTGAKTIKKAIWTAFTGCLFIFPEAKQSKNTYELSKRNDVCFCLGNRIMTQGCRVRAGTTIRGIPGVRGAGRFSVR